MNLKQKIEQQIQILRNINEVAVDAANNTPFPIMRDMHNNTSNSCKSSITSLQWVLAEIENEEKSITSK